jgi:hypothetical protein
MKKDRNAFAGAHGSSRLGTVVAVLVLLSISIFLLNLFLKSRRAMQPFAYWNGNTIQVSSVTDGPWIVTHLIVYQTNNSWRAVAQLPRPVTIFESGGCEFSRVDLDGFDWRDLAGVMQAPPATNERVGIMYVVPVEAKPPPVR